MVSILLSTLLDYIKTNKDHLNNQAQFEDVLDCSKRFFKALDEYIDYRISIKLEERRKHLSKDKLEAVNSINSSINSMASSVRSISALNTAPIPPNDPSDPVAMKKWTEAYNDWFHNERKKGMRIG